MRTNQSRLYQARRGHGGTAFTLIELLISIAIIGVLIAILVPALSRARAHGRVTACLSNLRGQGMSMLGYTVDYQGALPPKREWNYSENYSEAYDGCLINEILSEHDHVKFDPPLKQYDWCRPVGIWRCPDARDSARRTHSGIIHYAPNKWLFNSVEIYDGATYEVDGDAPPGWEHQVTPDAWRQIELVRQPSEIIALADDVNFLHTADNYRETRESMGYSKEIISDVNDGQTGELRASHAQIAKRPCLMVDGHAETLPPGADYWMNERQPYHPRSQPQNTTYFHAREAQRFMWFITADQMGTGVTSGTP